MTGKRRYRYGNRRRKQKRKNLLLLCLFLIGLTAWVLIVKTEKTGMGQDEEKGYESREPAEEADLQEEADSQAETDLQEEADSQAEADLQEEADLQTETDLPAETAELMEVHFIDVGQGDSVLIKCGEHAMLIDAGDNSKGTAVQLYLSKQGVSKLDYVIGTHPDADHIGGLDVIITKFDCGKVIMPEVERDTAAYRDVVMAMEYRGYQNTSPVPGETYQLGEAAFTVIAPNRDYGDDYNNASVGILLCHGANRFIFTGDAESEAEEDMLSNGMDLRADVLKAGHHGSSSSGSDDFLDAVNPKYAVISCGKGNSYGHPHAELLNSLRKREIQVFRTDEQGSIAVTSDGKTLSFNCAPSDTWRSGWEEGRQ